MPWRSGLGGWGTCSGPAGGGRLVSGGMVLLMAWFGSLGLALRRLRQAAQF